MILFYPLASNILYTIYFCSHIQIKLNIGLITLFATLFNQFFKKDIFIKCCSRNKYFPPRMASNLIYDPVKRYLWIKYGLILKF